MRERLQSGYFHVWFRGSSRFTVFYDDDDFIGFLTQCNKAAKKHNTKLTAFVLMDNHVHLQVYTQNLTLFVSSILIRYTRWLNKKKAFTGRLFETPFSSSPLHSRDFLERNLLYILTNPVRAGICSDVNKYLWSSYHFYQDSHTLKSKQYSKLKRYIDIDTSIMQSCFPTLNELNLKARNFSSTLTKPQLGGVQSGGVRPGGTQSGVARSGDVQSGGVRPGGVQSGGVRSGGVRSGGVQSGGTQSGGVRSGGVRPGGVQSGGTQSGGTQSGVARSGDVQSGGVRPGGVQNFSSVRRKPDYEIIKYLNTLLKGREFAAISKEERCNIVRTLIYREGATMLQIALILHESYYDIRKMCNEYPKD